jgi:hypothetical protein
MPQSHSQSAAKVINMKSIHVLGIAAVAIAMSATTSTATTSVGSVGDGRPSVAYVAFSGEMIVQPYQIPIGLFNLHSANGIFNANASFPPLGLVPVIDTATRKGWGTLPENALRNNWSLGRIAPSGLSQAYVRGDFTFGENSGFGTPTLDLDLVYVIPEPTSIALFTLAITSFCASRCRRRAVSKTNSSTGKR